MIKALLIFSLVLVNVFLFVYRGEQSDYIESLCSMPQQVSQAVSNLKQVKDKQEEKASYFENINDLWKK